MAIITASPSSFQKLLDLQRSSEDHLGSIRSILTDTLIAYQSKSDAQIDVTTKEDSKLDEVNKTLKKIASSLSGYRMPSNYSKISSAISYSNNLSNTSSATSYSNNLSNINSSALSRPNTPIVTKEDKEEAKKSEQDKLDVLIQIEKNTRHEAVAKSSKEITGDTMGLGGLGGLAAGLAVALGAIVGAFKAQMKAIKYFTQIFIDVEKIGASLRKSIASLAAGLSMSFDLLKSTISEKLSGVVKIFDTVIDAVKSAFAVGANSKIGMFIKSITQGLSKLFNPFVEAFTVIKDFLSGPTSKIFTQITETFGAITSKFSMFTGIIAKSAKIFGKLFLPLTIVMTIWDTVKGAIEGFEKEGIVGGISGAIKGLFNSLIFGPVEMLKDATAWVLDAFGFDKASKFLDSFNVEEMFSSYVDAIFHPIDTFKEMMKSIQDMFVKMKDFTIPEFSFTIPVIDKKVSIGPFTPFKSEAGTTPAAKSTDAATSIAPPPAKSAGQTVSSQSSTVSAMKENGATTSNIVSAPTVNNNVKQTSVAKVMSNVRTHESSVDRYFNTRAVY